MSKDKHESKSLKKRFKNFKRYFRRRKMVIIPIILIIVCVLFLFIFMRAGSKKDLATVGSGAVVSDPVEITATEDLVCVSFGDSVVGNTSVSSSFTDTIAAETGMEVYNLGINGTRLSGIPISDNSNDMEKEQNTALNAFSLHKLVDAITSGNYDLQDKYADTPALKGELSDKLNTMKTLNWSEVDYITICYGADDIRNYCSDLDDSENTLNTNTYLGALRYSIEKLEQYFPDTKIVLLTPIYRQLSETSYNSDSLVVKYTGVNDTINEVDLPFTAWCDGILRVGEEYSQNEKYDVIAIDLYKLTGFNRTNAEEYYRTGTGSFLIPNNAGHTVIGKIIVEKINENI